MYMYCCNNVYMYNKNDFIFGNFKVCVINGINYNMICL